MYYKYGFFNCIKIICLALIRPYFYMNLFFYLMFLVAVTGYILLLNSEIYPQDGTEKSQETPELTLDGVRNQPSVLTSGKNAI